jgi:signal transduction histidine kinase
MYIRIVWSFLLIAITTHGVFAEKIYSGYQIDSLRKELSATTGLKRISMQLVLANQVMKKDKAEALSLASSALDAAKSANSKSLKSKAYLILGRIKEELGNKDFAEACYDSALIISESSDDNWLKGEILFRKGVLKHRLNEEIDALKYLNEALQACRLSNNFNVMGSSYSMMGTIFRVNGLYDRAIEFIINARLNYEKAGSLDGKAWSSYILGRIYSDLKLPERALSYFNDALKIYTDLAAVDGNKEGVAICFEQIGLLYLDSGNFNEAQRYIDKTHEIYTDKNSKYGISNAYKNLGIIEYSVGNYNLAEKYLHEALKINGEVGDYLILPTIYEYIGLCSIGKGKRDEGLKSLKHGLGIAISNNQKKIQLNIYSKLTEVYLSINDLKNAIDCQKKQIEIQDLILTGAANIKIEQLQAIYEIDKKNRQIIELEKQNEINSLVIRQHRTWQFIMIIGILIAFVFSVVIYWFNTKIRSKNVELKATNAAKDKLFAVIAHDLRGPTGNLTLFLDYLKNSFDELSPDELKQILSSLSESAESVNVLLENLLIWAKSQLNKIEYNPVEQNLSELIRYSLKGLMLSAEDKQIDIQFELNDDIAVVADSNMVQTIVRNLISNAIKFTYRGGSVIIRTNTSDKNNARINIIDTGVGIEQSSLAHLFDISNTLHTPGTENEKSTGLGLILVKDFVEKNNGTITIDSQKGIGTTVSFTLPLA